MSDTNLETLFLRWRDQRNTDALASVFEETAPALLRLARHLAPAGAEAEDLLQTTFLVALEAPHEWDPERPLVPWLAGILGRRALHERRRGARAPEADRLRAPSPVDPVAATLEGETVDLLNSALERVPERYRAVLEGRLVEDRPASDLARELGRSSSTVHVQMHRGLHILRRILPASLAPGAARAASSASELSAVRRAVLREARRLAGQRALFSSGSVPLIGIGAGLLFAAVAWFLAHEGTQPGEALVRDDPTRNVAAASGERLLVEPLAEQARTAAHATALVAQSQDEVEPPKEEQADEVDDGESGLVRWWIVGRVIAPSGVDHGERAWEGTKVRVAGPGVGMEFGVVRNDGEFRQPMLSPPPWKATGADGEAEADLALTFEVSHPEHLPGTRVVALDERLGDTLSVELELLPAGRVRGAATDGAGADLPACFTQIYPLADEQLGAPAIADRGFRRPSSYEMLAAPGHAVVAVGLGGKRPGGARTLVLEGTSHTLAPIVLEEGATLEGRILDPFDSDALVEARLEGAGATQPLGPLAVTWHGGRLEWSIVRAPIDSEGRFVLQGLVPGARYRVSCSDREVIGVAGAGSIEL